MAQKTQAIEAAQNGEWIEAIKLNEELLKESADDIETLNRLAFAYSISGNTKKALKIYQKVIAIDKFNQIALKNLKRLQNQTEKSTIVPYHLTSNFFLEEAGKTKIVTLVNIAPTKILQSLQPGQLITLSIKRLKIFANDENKRFIGMLPDNISIRLIKFIKSGNSYEAYVRSTNDKDVEIFIRETKRTTRLQHQPSFLSGDKKTSTTLMGKNKSYNEDEE